MNQRMIVQISHPLSETNMQIPKKYVQKIVCRGHVGVGDMWVWGHEGVRDMWVLGTSGCRGHVCWGTCGCGGHVGVGDMWVRGR